MKNLALIVAITLILSPLGCGHPAYAVDTPAGATDFDPFARLDLKPGDMLPPIRCMPREKYEAAIAAHDGSKLIPLDPKAAGFWMGFYAAQPYTPPGYPIGDSVLLSVRAASNEEGKAVLEGVIAVSLGEFVICNAVPVPDAILSMLFKAEGAMPKDTR